MAAADALRGDGRALAEQCRRLDGRGYPAYRDLEGGWALGGGLTLFLDRAARDPFAPPSPVRLRLAADAAGFPPEFTRTRLRRMALADCLARRVAEAADSRSGATSGSGRSGRSGSGNSGRIRNDAGGQQVLERSAVRVESAPPGAPASGWVEARVEVGLPAAGRRILGGRAETLLTADLPEVAAALACSRDRHDEMAAFLRGVEVQEHLRQQLRSRGLVAFVADGAVLPRLHGASELPLPAAEAVPFESPPSLRVRLSLPEPGGLTGGPESGEGGEISGMGIPEGVTLIVGGGYHGKSTLLQALAAAVFPHLPGDGRERSATRGDAVTIRAEEGRPVHAVDVRPFIRDLPGGRSTEAFTTENASGSTSQAASLVEALEAGSRLLLLDEDTSATNLMIRDARMQALVAREAEPIVPLVDRVRHLHEVHGVSAVLVMGGSGDYFEAADTVLRMEDWRAADATAEARAVARSLPHRRQAETGGAPFFARERRPLADRFAGVGRRGRTRVKADSPARLRFGEEEADLAALTALFDPSQTRAAGYAAALAAERFRDRTLPEVLDALEDFLDREGLDALTPEGRAGRHPGRLARPRRYEIAGLLNRLRGGGFESRPAPRPPETPASARPPPTGG